MNASLSLSLRLTAGLALLGGALAFTSRAQAPAASQAPSSATAPTSAPSAAKAPATASASVIGVPAKNWVLPLFTPKEGFRNLTLRGSEVRPISAAQIDVVDFNATIFSGDAAAHVETILLSPQASFYPKEQRAAGQKTVRLIRDDIEVTGDGWVYEHAAKKVSLARNARVVFAAQLNDILK